jgi:hypothetical protein
VKGQVIEHWLELRKQAADERDPAKLLDFIQEINRLLEAKEKRLRNPSAPPAE